MRFFKRNMTLENLKKDLNKLANTQKAKDYERYFKTGKGEYAEGDIFLGISIPDQRKIVSKYYSLSLSDIEKLLASKIHEHRMCALFLLVNYYQKQDKEKAVKFYFKNIKYINNWDLVDLSAYKILGDFFFEKDKKELEALLYSDSIWEKRIAMVSTYGFIQKGDTKTTFKYAKILLGEEHDLIHKAVGWMLREAGKKDKKALIDFIEKNYKKMPRTTLRYSIERFNLNERKRFLEKR
ncbi:MAG: DNA alkylation repair protein [Candidatus Pacebacteria bacterium]|nr:DNA alkylation repair protein [Candidatus Paceibacterota bacterium]MDD5721953.1 DNA alkylation repair protein [Candidatus Paceibacterota bacterium]